MKKQVLFVTEKYCDGNPDMGLTNSVHNLFGSFAHTFDIAAEYDYKTIHFDEIALKGKHIDDFAQQIYEKTKPDVMFCTLLGTEKCNPTERFFSIFKQAGCKIVFIYPDFGRDWTTHSAMRFIEYTDLIVAIAGEKNFNLPQQILNKLHYSWTPEDPAYFYYDGQEKDIDVLFLGTSYSRERQEIIDFLKNNLDEDIKCHFGGGQRHEKLSHEKYAELTRRSKMIVNFPWSAAGNDQLKGRVFEATACKCLLMERKNILTPLYFEPGKEYVEYTSKEDLLEKIIIFKDHPEFLEPIANAGLTRYIQNWTHNKFWQNLFEKIYE